MSELNKIKLGKRLTSIEKMVSTDYDHIWDCCCDHGLLGFQLLENNKAKHIHFVDVVAPLLEEIESKLTRFYRGESQWYIHCDDVATLLLPHDKNQKHLIIIAGIGGQLLISLLTKLLPLTAGLNVEFILSPVHHNYQLRTFLNKQSCGLIHEAIVEENKRFYELIHFDNHCGVVISKVGEKMWDFNNRQHQNYLTQTLQHYQRMAKNPNIDVSEIIKAYQDLKPAV